MVVNSYERNWETKIKFILLYQILITSNLEICYHSRDGSVCFSAKALCEINITSFTNWETELSYHLMKYYIICDDVSQILNDSVSRLLMLCSFFYQSSQQAAFSQLKNCHHLPGAVA